MTASPSDEIWNALALQNPSLQIDRGAVISELAELSPTEYEQRRTEAAKQLNMRVSVLDEAVKKLRQPAADDKQGGSALTFESVEPCTESVDGSELLSSLYNTVRRFVVCDPKTAHAAALWIIFTWLIDEVQVAPIAMITAPEKRCGKTVLLSLFNRLCHRPLPAANISPAAIFRCIEASSPTLLIDEADAFLRDNENARGILNSGHTRDTAFVVRVVGDNHEPRQFSTWGAKAIAGIGRLADTLTDRSIPLELRRKLPNETVESIRYTNADYFLNLKQQIARWVVDHAAAIRQTRPKPVNGINDRAQDNWEPLFAIADIAGGDWPNLARGAAFGLCGVKQEGPSLNAELLSDIAEIFAAKNIQRIPSADLIQALCADEEKPWLTWNRGQQISARQLSARLESFGIRSRQIRFGTSNRRGYELAQFQDAFSRYVPTGSDESATTLPTAGHLTSGDFQSATRNPVVADENCGGLNSDAGCSDVADNVQDDDEKDWGTYKL